MEYDMIDGLDFLTNELFCMWHAAFIAHRSADQLTFPDHRLQYETIAMLHVQLLLLHYCKRQLERIGATGGLSYHTIVMNLDFWTYMLNQLTAGYTNDQQGNSTG